MYIYYSKSLPRQLYGKRICLPRQELWEMPIRSLVQEEPPGENGNRLQYSYLENSMGRGAWPGTAHEVANSWTQLSDNTHARTCTPLYYLKYSNLNKKLQNMQRNRKIWHITEKKQSIKNVPEEVQMLNKLKNDLLNQLCKI